MKNVLNLNRLKKDEILWLFNNHCKAHGHRYIEHIQCYFKEKNDSPMKERIGTLDIEASNLKATFGIVLTYCIKRLDGETLARTINPKDIKNETYDKNLMKQLIKDLKEFDRIVVYYGGDGRFDLPFLRSRCLFHGLDFPLYKEVKVLDLYPIVRYKFCLHSNRLATVCDFLGITSKEHPIKYNIWMGALSGNVKAINYIKTHNIEDVESTEALYKKIVNFSAPANKSI